MLYLVAVALDQSDIQVTGRHFELEITWACFERIADPNWQTVYNALAIEEVETVTLIVEATGDGFAGDIRSMLGIDSERFEEETETLFKIHYKLSEPQPSDVDTIMTKLHSIFSESFT